MSFRSAGVAMSQPISPRASSSSTLAPLAGSSKSRRTVRVSAQFPGGDDSSSEDERSHPAQDATVDGQYTRMALLIDRWTAKPRQYLSSFPQFTSQTVPDANYERPEYQSLACGIPANRQSSASGLGSRARELSGVEEQIWSSRCSSKPARAGRLRRSRRELLPRNSPVGSP